MDVTQVLFLSGIVLFFGLFAEWLFVKTKVPDVFWMLMLGLILQLIVGRPSGLDDVALLFTTFGLIFIVFEGASTIPLRQAARHFKGATTVSLLNFTAAFILGTLLGKLLGLNWAPSFVIGCLGSTLSGGIIGQIQKYVRTQSGTGTLQAFEAAVTDVIAILGVVTILSFARLTFADFLSTLINFLLVSVVVGFLLAIVWVKLLKSWITEHAYILTIAFLLILFSATEYVGGNGSVAAMSFAFTLGNMKSVAKIWGSEEKAHLSGESKRFYSEISFIIRSFLFVWMGLIITFNDPLFLLGGALLTAILFVIRSYTVKCLKDLSTNDRRFVAVIAPKDITPLVLAALAASKFSEPALLSFALGIIVSSILLTSLLVYLTEEKHFKGFEDLIQKKLPTK